VQGQKFLRRLQKKSQEMMKSKTLIVSVPLMIILTGFLAYQYGYLRIQSDLATIREEEAIKTKTLQKYINLISENLLEISEKANRGQGLMGKLFADTLFSRQLDSAGYNLQIITGDIAKITDKVNAGEGIFGRLFTDTLLIHNLYLSSINLEKTTQNLTEFSHRLTDNENALSRFIADTAFADSLAFFMHQLNTGIREVTRSSEAIQNSGLIRMFSRKKGKK